VWASSTYPCVTCDGARAVRLVSDASVASLEPLSSLKKRASAYLCWIFRGRPSDGNDVRDRACATFFGKLMFGAEEQSL
jgi:hypothetical protein